MNQRIRYDVFYPHPPDRIWKALTDPAALTQWLMPTNFNPSVGHRFQFVQPPPIAGLDGMPGHELKRIAARKDRARRGETDPATVCCEVVTVEAPRRLAYTWQSDVDPEPTLVTWTLEPVDGGTRVLLEHSAIASTTISMIERTENWSMALTIDLPLALARADTAATSVIVGSIQLKRSGYTAERLVPLVGRHRSIENGILSDCSHL